MDQIEDNTSAAATPTWTPESAYQQTLPELTVLPDVQLLVVNLDIPRLVAKILGTLPELRELERRMAAGLRKPYSGLVERLERRAWALQHTHWISEGHKADRPDPARIARELAPLRQRIFGCVRALIAYGVLDAERFAPYEFVKSQRSLARSVFGIVVVCQAEWNKIRDKSPLSRAELERAFALATQLSVAHQARGCAPAPLLRALRERQQVFTLVLREYTELRRAAQFLHGRTAEADHRVPSLYRKSARRARTAAVLAAS